MPCRATPCCAQVDGRLVMVGVPEVPLDLNVAAIVFSEWPDRRARIRSITLFALPSHALGPRGRA